MHEEDLADRAEDLSTEAARIAAQKEAFEAALAAWQQQQQTLQHNCELILPPLRRPQKLVSHFAHSIDNGRASTRRKHLD